MLRAPLSLAKMSYDTASGTVIYRSKMHAGLKRNFQVMPGAEWLELLCKHISDRYEHLVRQKIGNSIAPLVQPVTRWNLAQALTRCRAAGQRVSAVPEWV